MNAALQGPRVWDTHRLLNARRENGWIPLVLKHGKTFFYQKSLATCDPVLVETLLMHRPHTLHRSELYKWASKNVPGAPGVLFMEGEEWQQHVHAVMPVFTKSHVDTYTQTIHETAVGYASRWQDNQRLPDLYTAVVELGMRVILRCGYGLDPDSELATQLSKELIGYKMQTMTTRYRLDTFGFSMLQLAVLPGFIMGAKQLENRVKRLGKIIEAIIQERQLCGYEGLDWIQQLSSADFPLPVITDEINHIYGAFNAIDYTLTCALKELSQRPDWVEIISRELRQTLGERAFPTREDFDALPKTIGFMKEVFRHYPVAMVVARRTGEPLDVDGVNIPAETEALIMVYALHHHPDFWDQPETFDPDRWQKPLREPNAFIPFLTGPRQCIGRHLAELHFVVVLNALLQRYDFKVLDQDVRIGPYMIPRFERAIPCLVHHRPE